MSFSWCLVCLLLLQVAGSATLTKWPKGRYGLLKPTSGCPTGWSGKGWALQDTENDNPSNKRSKILNMDGFVAPSNVLKYFCIKPTSTSGPNWPKGQYCIYRSVSNRPEGMTWGRIRLYDENNSGRKNTYGITTSNSAYTNFFFYCYTSGNKKIPIPLPITKPFYLLPYGSSDCQQVQWMVATSEWIKYQTNNYAKRQGQESGTVPYYEVGDVNHKGITMFYCYYQSCKYILNDTSGVFQSPGFPGQYPDGQLCSWRIMVPDNHTLHVRFTNFSLEENDNVTLFKSYNGGFHFNDTFKGHHSHPFIISATTDVLFVFQTNKEGNSTGFRAEYTVSKASETTTSPPSTNRNIDHTTPVPTTEANNKTNHSTADTFLKFRKVECDGADTTVLVVIPLICLIVVIAVVIIILYRWRSMKKKCEKCDSTRYPKEDVINPTYDNAEHFLTSQRISTATMNTTVGTDDDGQMYQALSHDQQPQYEAPDYSKQHTDEPSMDSGYPEYNELEPMDNNGPGVVYDVLEGPDSNDGPGVVYDVLEGPDSSDQMYQALNKETTHNPLYQSTTPATMVTRNPMYVDSVA